MILHALDFDEFCKNLPEIKEFKHSTKKLTEANGLFSQQIFGPLKSYNCACTRNNFHHRNTPYTRCPKCGVEITTSLSRRKNFAKISLPRPIINPLFLLLIKKLSGATQTIINGLIYCNFYIKLVDDKELDFRTYNTQEEENELRKDGYVTSHDAFNVYLDYLLKFKNKDSDYAKFIADHRNLLFINNILIIPPAFRPKNKCGVSDKVIQDKINEFYALLINLCSSYNAGNMPTNGTRNYNLHFQMTAQKHAIAICNLVLKKLSDKSGLLRNNLLGKRLDFSGRAVISPDPTLALGDCKIPYFMLLEMFKPQLTVFLVDQKICKRFSFASLLIGDCIKNHDFQLMDHLKKFCKDKVCILNRQPTLHRLGVLGFNIIPDKGNTIKLHVLLCSAYNADFDGDAVSGCYLTLYNDSFLKQGKLKIDDFKEKHLLVLKSEKNREDGVKVTKYKLEEKLYINTISLYNGSIEKKQIHEFSIHEGLIMYNVIHPKIEKFHMAGSHGLIIYNQSTNKIERSKIEDILNDRTNKFILKRKINAETN